MASFKASFAVKATTGQGESVFVTGNCAELGSWKAEAAKQLKNDGEVWSRKIQVSAEKVEYRYFTGYYRNKPDGSQGIIATKWETNLSPRILVCRDVNAKESLFGSYGGSTSISKGWLQGQTEVQARFHSNPISMRKQSHKELNYRLECSAIDMLGENTQDVEGDNAAVTAYPVLVSILDGENEEPKEQPQSGVLVEDDCFILFRAQTFDSAHLALRFNIYAHDSRSSSHAFHKLIGSSYYVPLSSDESLGTRVLPITDNTAMLIGNLTVEYLVITPLPSFDCDMYVSYANYWNKDQPSLDMGHRGMGNSHSGIRATVRENSLASLSGAGNNGADYVEFDVQLSSDNVPVIYHDFMTCVSLKKKGNDELEYHAEQVSDLSFEQLQDLKLDHLSVKGTKHSGDTDPDESLHTRPFPTLRECLDLVEPYIGFNVEIKYPQKMKDGTMEDGVKQFPDRNPYLDIILTEILQHAGKRRILFSCFDADTCAMIKLKQNKYPVVFLCSGPVCGYNPYFDRRTWDVPSAVKFAVSEELLGINPNSMDFLRDASLVKSAIDRKLIVCCWGKENNDRGNIKRLKEMGVHGVIYDRVYELAEEGKVNIFKGSS